ncbi:SPOR domain-containing protein [Kiloniella laminariae]|uniref:SPOR domain-containing protein n=1 Tax=Kiloniella laminariae TaxID=454162 RepID=A0ABT4LG71_9PROT|nr:SPOR domain-containing protein [Kiloniella laminariae]MCZ4280103.1 SPOR domain-containing protein [Kiloniella laminariae]
MRVFPCRSLLFFALSSAVFLAGCGEIYDDTKGWAPRFLTEIKKSAKESPPPDETAIQPTEPAQEEIKVTALEPATGVPSSDKIKADAKTAKPPVQKTATKQPAAPATSSKGTYAIHLASNKSKESAQKEWTELKNAFPQETKGLSFQTKQVEVTGKGTFYRVLGAPFTSREAASTVCEELKRKKQYCAVIKI